MVPHSLRYLPTSASFPRASGDGPGIGAAGYIRLRFPPRERGWSLHQEVSSSLGDVSPARAGMVPGSKLDVVVRCGFPRASGDGPPNALFCVRAAAFPPRERGWSLADSFFPLLSCVSPARAGMVPGKSASLRNLDPFPPRERGWSRDVLGKAASRDVSPARAGMVPHSLRYLPTSASFPRASGDGPAQQGQARPARRFPPRERGWSLWVFRSNVTGDSGRT